VRLCLPSILKYPDKDHLIYICAQLCVQASLREIKDERRAE
jgi:hypothetical protein